MEDAELADSIREKRLFAALSINCVDLRCQWKSGNICFQKRLEPWACPSTIRTRPGRTNGEADSDPFPGNIIPFKGAFHQPPDMIAVAFDPEGILDDQFHNGRS